MQDQWTDLLNCYMPILNKTAAFWASRLHGRIEPNEIKNELILRYTDVYPRSKSLPKKEFIKYLRRSFNNHVVDLIRSSPILLNISDITIYADQREFRSMCFQFCIEQAERILPDDSRFLLNTVLSRIDDLHEAQAARRRDVSRKYGLCLRDVQWLMSREFSWTRKRVLRAAVPIKEMLRCA